MCGIVGIVGQHPVASRLLKALQRLEYRGYDSAGIGVLTSHVLDRRRATGKIQTLQKHLTQNPLDGTTGIGHTRWATHGIPSVINAHPHGTERVLLVHNGIVDNFGPFKKDLQQKGIIFESDTDSEVLAHLIDQMLGPQITRQTLPQALQAVFQKLEGSFACAILLKEFPDTLITYRKGGCPLAIGYGEKETFCGSDAIALAGLSETITYLEDGDCALLTPQSVTFWNAEGLPAQRPTHSNAISVENLDKGPYSHFMRKEISAQPQILDNLLKQNTLSLDISASDLSSITIVACGTAYYAGLVASHWFEHWAQLPTQVKIASEFRHNRPPLLPDSLALFISQSGETADTIGAMNYVREMGKKSLSVVNVPQSSLERLADFCLQTQAGPEISVASTKAFTAQLMTLLLLSLHISEKRHLLVSSDIQKIQSELFLLPSLLSQVITSEPEIQTIAQNLTSATSALYLGRGILAPLASVGALKLKELSYIHAEGYPAGELKHGPIALLDDTLPVIVLAPSGPSFEKLLSNIQEVAARKAPLIILTDTAGQKHLQHLDASFLLLPETSFATSPFVYAVALQLLAYHTAYLRGADVDQPRNLAKSVTVE